MDAPTDYAVMIGDNVRGIARCTDAGWSFARDGVSFDATGGATSASVIPYKRGDYRLASLAAATTETT